MRNKFTRSHIAASFVLHILLFSFFAFFDDSSTIHRKFIVFGVHSKKPSKALFRPASKPTPFVGDPKSFLRRQREIRKKRRGKKRSKKSRKKVAKKKHAKRNLKKNKKQAQKPAQKRKQKNKPKKVQVKKAHKPPVKKKLAQTSMSQDKKNNKKIKKKKIKKPKKQQVTKKKIVKEEVLNPKKKKEKSKKLLAQNKKKEQKKEKPEKIKKNDVLDDEDERDEEDEPEELHFSLLYESDPLLLQYQRSIQKEVARLWHPPVGVSKNTECSVSFSVNKCGQVEHFEFLKRSKILIYDLSITRVAKKFTFDSCLWGKRFTVDFRQ